MEQRQQFVNFPYALYALDVKFQPAYRPGGRFGEQLRYFSGKHKLYGFKIKCAVVNPGLAIHVSAHYPGSASDLSICFQNAPKHRELLLKSDEALRRQQQHRDYGEGSTDFPDMWGVLVDKGYQGIHTHLRGIHPTRKPRGGELSHTERERNKRISSDRVLVENYFGRLSSLWRVMFTTFKWNEDKYDQLVRICVALTNFHVTLSPLRAEDSDNYQRQMARYVSMGEALQLRRSRTNVLDEARRIVRARTSYSDNSPVRSTAGSTAASPASTVMSSQSEHMYEDSTVFTS